jgi:hypothetical protein
VEFWQIASGPDDENFGAGVVAPGTTFGGGQLQLSLLGLDTDPNTPGIQAKFEKWQRLTPSFNGYDSTIQGTVSLCAFDPGDDQQPPADETFCDNAAGPVMNDKGDFFGTDETCVTDTDNNDDAHKDCGASTCAYDPNNPTDCLMDSSFTTSGGVWNRSAFNISPFVGRIARLRWIAMMDGGWSFGNSRSAMEPSPPPAYQLYDGDDGWMIDSIKITDLRVAPAQIGPDGTPKGNASCVTGENVGNCATISASIVGMTTATIQGYCPRGDGIVGVPNPGTCVGGGDALLGAACSVGSDCTGPGNRLNGGALLQSVRLDARGSTASGTTACINGDGVVGPPHTGACTNGGAACSLASDCPAVAENPCDNGVLQYKWTCVSGDCATPLEVVQDFSPRGTVIVAPGRDTTYRLDVKCSSDTACTNGAAGTLVTVQKYTAEGQDVSGLGSRDGVGLQVFHGGDDCNRNTVPGSAVFASSTAQICWPVGPQVPGSSGYDVYSFDDRGAATGTAVFPSNTFGGTRCVASALPNLALGAIQTTSDTDAVASGRVNFYQVGHHTAGSHAAALGIVPVSGLFAPANVGQVVLSGVGVCP